MADVRCLAPLPYVAAAAPILRSLGVTTRIAPGWSLVALTLATIALTYRPARHIAFQRRAGSLVIHTHGGTRLDYPANMPQDLTHTFTDLLTRATCELCGRPGRHRYRPGPVVLCDSCAFLIENPGLRLPFQPRLPLLESAAIAAGELVDTHGLDKLPAGWADAALAVVRDFRGIDPASVFTVDDGGTHLDVRFSSNADKAVLRRLSASLARRTAALCRHCGRPVLPKSPYTGQCEGCVELDEYGAETVPFEQGWITDDRSI